MTSVAIVEDNAGVRKGLERAVNEAPGLKCACACGSGEEALVQIPRHGAEVVLMDIHLPNLSGIECTARLKTGHPAVQVIMLTVYEESEKIFNALQAGACGYLLKRSSPESIIAAIEDVRRGGAPMTSEIARKVVAAFQTVPAAPPEHNLSRRETEILELLARGFSNKEIAAQLSITIETVKGHLRHVYDKLHVRSRAEAAIHFISARETQAPAGVPPKVAKMH